MLFIGGCAFLLVVSIARPRWIKRWVNAVLVWVNKIGFLKSKYLLRAARWINHEITSYNDNIKLSSPRQARAGSRSRRSSPRRTSSLTCR